MAAKSKITLEVNEEEKAKIINFLTDQDMMSCITDIKPLKIKYPKKTYPKKRLNISEKGGNDGGCDDSGGSNRGGFPPHDPSSDELQEGQCPFCFINPCIAMSNNNAPWLGNGQPASHANPQIRKGIYRRFWKCINNMYGWLMPQYLDKKRRIGGGEWVVMHQREIMPECVLELVRDLYPNPQGIPYLGHTWE